MIHVERERESDDDMQGHTIDVLRSSINFITQSPKTTPLPTKKKITKVPDVFSGTLPIRFKFRTSLLPVFKELRVKPSMIPISKTSGIPSQAAKTVPRFTKVTRADTLQVAPLAKAWKAFGGDLRRGLSWVSGCCYANLISFLGFDFIILKKKFLKSIVVTGIIQTEKKLYIYKNYTHHVPSRKMDQTNPTNPTNPTHPERKNAHFFSATETLAVLNNSADEASQTCS